jgi:hypothetical protein
MNADNNVCVLFGFSGVLLEPSQIDKLNLENNVVNVLARDAIELLINAGVAVAVVVTLPQDYYYASTSWIRSYFGPEVTVYYRNSNTEKTPLATKKRAYEDALDKKYKKIYFVDDSYKDLLVLSSEHPLFEEYFILIDGPKNQAPWTPLLQRIGNHSENDSGWADLISHIIVEEK